MKKLFAFLSIFVVMLSCFGCSKQAEMPSAIIGLGLFTQPDGTLVQQIEFSAQSKKLMSLNLNAIDVIEARNDLTRNINKIREEFYISFLIRYSQAPNQEFRFGKGINISKTVYNETYDSLSFSISFANQDAFNFYHPSSSGSSSKNDDALKTLNPFLVKSVSVGQFPFSAKVEVDGQKITLGQRYLNMYNSSFYKFFGENYKNNIDPVSFVYDYGARYERMKSDASYTLSSGGLHHHVWVKNVDELENATIKLSVAIPNKGLWQLTFLCVVFAGTLCMIIFIKFKNKKGPDPPISPKQKEAKKIYIKKPKNKESQKGDCAPPKCKKRCDDKKTCKKLK